MSRPPAARAGAPDDFETYDFTHGRSTRRVLRRGDGPGVVLMHELPGMTPECLRLARRVAAAGFDVHLPLLFGEVGDDAAARNLLKLCVSREFALLAAHGPSPVTDWLRALCRHVHAQRPGRGIGVIGMCLTGGFVLSAMLEPAVLAAVAAEPALPLAAWTDRRRRALGVPADHVVQAARRDGAALVGLRFTGDRLCPRQRFDTLEAAFGDRFLRVEIASEAGNRHGIDAAAHSVLTRHFVDREGHPTREALCTVLAFLSRRLEPAA